MYIYIYLYVKFLRSSTSYKSSPYTVYIRIPCVPAVYTWLSRLWLRMITLDFLRRAKRSQSTPRTLWFTTEWSWSCPTSVTIDGWKRHTCYDRYENCISFLDRFSMIFLNFLIYDFLRLNIPRFVFELWSYLCRLLCETDSLHGGLSAGSWRVYVPAGVIEDIAGANSLQWLSMAFISTQSQSTLKALKDMLTCSMCKHYCQEESHPRNWKRHANYCWGNSFAGIPDGSFNLQVWCHCSRLRLPDTQSALLLGLGLVLSICRRFPRKIARMPPFIQDSFVCVLPFDVTVEQWHWWSMCYCSWLMIPSRTRTSGSTSWKRRFAPPTRSAL